VITDAYQRELAGRRDNSESVINPACAPLALLGEILTIY
jgi:hypothetical protein